MRTGIFALDQNSWTGFAVEQIGGHPILGSRHFPRANPRMPGPQGLAFQIWLRESLESYRPERVIYETPLPPIKQASTIVGSVTQGFAYVIEIVCAGLKIPVVTVSQGTWCKDFTGSGKRDKNTKGRVLLECARRGFDPPDDNAADALGILAYAVKLYYPTDRLRNAGVANFSRLAA